MSTWESVTYKRTSSSISSCNQQHETRFIFSYARGSNSVMAWKVFAIREWSKPPYGKHLLIASQPINQVSESRKWPFVFLRLRAKQINSTDANDCHWINVSAIDIPSLLNHVGLRKSLIVVHPRKSQGTRNLLKNYHNNSVFCLDSHQGHVLIYNNYSAYFSLLILGFHGLNLCNYSDTWKTYKGTREVSNFLAIWLRNNYEQLLAHFKHDGNRNYRIL